jgi:hypothetical protein
MKYTRRDIMPKLSLAVLLAVLTISVLSCDSGSSDTSNPVYSILYNGNGNTSGSAPIDNTSYTNGDSATILGNTEGLVKMQDGISLLFIGWNTEGNGSGTQYVPNDSVMLANSDITLYAQWSVIRGTGPGGGIVFYDKETYSNDWRYIEVSADDIEPIVLHNWSDFGTFSITNATGIDFGTAKSNTELINGAQAQADSAAQICADYEGGGYIDWYLPSIDEVYEIYLKIYSFNTGGINSSSYWSSSETGENTAWIFNFNTGLASDNTSKNSEVYVRAIRYF